MSTETTTEKTVIEGESGSFQGDNGAYSMLTTIDPEKPLRQASSSERKQLIYNSLKAQGYNPYQISQIMGIHSKTAYRRDKNSDVGILASLVSPAKKAIKSALKGEKVGDSQAPKMSDVLTAAKMVMDREAPAIQRVESRHLSARVEITAEERERYKASLGLPTPQHIVDAEVIPMIDQRNSE